MSKHRCCRCSSSKQTCVNPAKTALSTKCRL